MIRLLFDIDNERSLEKSLEVTELIFFQDEPTLNTKKMQLYIFVRFHHCGDFFWIILVQNDHWVIIDINDRRNRSNFPLWWYTLKLSRSPIYRCVRCILVVCNFALQSASDDESSQSKMSILLDIVPLTSIISKHVLVHNDFWYAHPPYVWVTFYVIFIIIIREFDSNWYDNIFSQWRFNCTFVNRNNN